MSKIRMLELSLSRTFVPGNESSMYGTFALGNENVMELSFLGAKMTWNFRSRERKYCGTFALSQKRPGFTENTNGKNTLMFEIVNIYINMLVLGVYCRDVSILVTILSVKALSICCKI